MAARQSAREKRGRERHRRDQPQPLMDFQHVRALVEPRLVLRAALRLRVRKSQIAQVRFRWVRLRWLRISLILRNHLRKLDLREQDFVCEEGSWLGLQVVVRDDTERRELYRDGVSQCTFERSRGGIAGRIRSRVFR